MSRPFQRDARSLLVLTLNVALLICAISLYGRYTTIYQERLHEENLGNIANLNQSAATNATALMESWDNKLGDVVQYIQRHNLTFDQALALLEDANSSQSRQFELIRADYTGFLARRDESGAFIPLSYQASAYADLQKVLDASAGAEHGVVRFAPEFTDNYTALKYFAICTSLPIVSDDGGVETCTLLLASNARDVLAVFNSQSVFDGLSTVLVDANGSYIVSSDDFKSDNFFQYLYVYNDLTLDQRNAIMREVAGKGSGEIFYADYMGRDCVFRYAKMTASDWYCITCVPLASFRTPSFNINYALYAVLALLLMLVLDVFWLRGMNRRLQASMLREKEASDAKTDFLSRMSHDIRTPLNGVIGMTLLAMDEPNPPNTREYLSHIKVSGDFLLGLVNDILDMSRVESGKMAIHLEPYASADFCKYVEAVIVPLAKEKGVAFRMSPPPGGDVAMFDRLRVNQIFFNLLSNAVKYTPAGGQVELFWERTVLPEGRIAFDFTVRDNGIGMSEDFQKRMFEPFAQERVEMTSTGSGLGLAIVRRLVDLMGGRISASSKENEGTSFCVHLETDVCVVLETEVATARGAELTGKRVLLCEDIEINRMIAERLLNKWGMIVDSAANGKIGLEMFSEAPPGTYQAILMDIRMPVMDGLEATRALRLKPEAAGIPIIAMTANAYDTDVKNCLDAGMNAHLSKPIQPERLRELLVRLML